MKDYEYFKKQKYFRNKEEDSVVLEVVGVDIERDNLFVAPVYVDFLTDKLIVNYRLIEAYAISNFDDYLVEHPEEEK